jgi:hypothetical protein
MSGRGGCAFLFGQWSGARHRRHNSGDSARQQCRGHNSFSRHEVSPIWFANVPKPGTDTDTSHERQMLLNRYRLEDWLSCTKARVFPVIGMGTFASGAKTYYGEIA